MDRLSKRILPSWWFVADGAAKKEKRKKKKKGLNASWVKSGVSILWYIMTMNIKQTRINKQEIVACSVCAKFWELEELKKKRDEWQFAKGAWEALHVLHNSSMQVLFIYDVHVAMYWAYKLKKMQKIGTIKFYGIRNWKVNFIN